MASWLVAKLPGGEMTGYLLMQFPAFGKSVTIEIFACCLQNSTLFGNKSTHFGHKLTHSGQKVSLNYHSYKNRILE